jgi:glycosyltransferase involved in cell wall biosynthesis
LSSPWLCVLIPTLDGAEHLAEALASVARENDPGVRCIVVDGGSKDGTIDIVKDARSRLSLTLLERPDSPGWVWSTNRALDSAQATYCCMLHQDDLWLPGRAAALKSILSEDPGLAMVVHPVRYVDRVGGIVGRLSCPWRSWPKRLEPAEALRGLLVQNFIATPGAVFRTDAARTVGGLDESLWYTADWDFWLKLASLGRVAYLDRDLAAFRLHAGSQTARRSVDASEFRKQLELVLDRHLGKAPDVRPVAKLSIEANVALAIESHGGKADWTSFAKAALAAGPIAIMRYWRDSRILSRVLSRIRAGGGTHDGESPFAAAFRRHRLIRFLIVAALNTLFSYAVFAALVFAGVGVRWASLWSLVAGILLGFVTQGKIVFLAFGRWSFVKFLLVSALLYHVFIGIVFIVEALGGSSYLGGAITVPIIAPLSYWLQSRFVFPARPEAERAPS